MDPGSPLPSYVVTRRGQADSLVSPDSRGRRSRANGICHAISRARRRPHVCPAKSMATGAASFPSWARATFAARPWNSGGHGRRHGAREKAPLDPVAKPASWSNEGRGPIRRQQLAAALPTPQPQPWLGALRSGPISGTQRPGQESVTENSEKSCNTLVWRSRETFAKRQHQACITFLGRCNLAGILACSRSAQSSRDSSEAPSVQYLVDDKHVALQSSIDSGFVK